MLIRCSISTKPGAACFDPQFWLKLDIFGDFCNDRVGIELNKCKYRLFCNEIQQIISCLIIARVEVQTVLRGWNFSCMISVLSILYCISHLWCESKKKNHVDNLLCEW